MGKGNNDRKEALTASREQLVTLLAARKKRGKRQSTEITDKRAVAGLFKVFKILTPVVVIVVTIGWMFSRDVTFMDWVGMILGSLFALYMVGIILMVVVVGCLQGLTKASKNPDFGKNADKAIVGLIVGATAITAYHVVKNSLEKKRNNPYR